MILLLDTSTPMCRLTLVDGDKKLDYEWHADRELSKGLHEFINDKLAKHNWTWRDIKGVGAFRGPGSFTGLRIGLVVVNTLADGLGVPIVGVDGHDWQSRAIKRLQDGENEMIVLPEYGASANITKPRK